MPLFGSLCVAAFLSLGLLVGCATRLNADLAADAASRSDVAPTASDVAIVIIPSDVGQALPDAGDALDEAAPTPVGSGPPTVPKLPPPVPIAIGLACGADGDCQSGSCVDGVCCAAAACDACQSCAVAGALGRCSPRPAGAEDPKSSCTGTMACNGKGRCAAHNGNACQTVADCLSGFCVDGVCCETACQDACFSCNTVFELRGTCQPLTAGEDYVASSPCTGSRSCSTIAGSAVPVCRLNDGQPCAAASDCVSGQCSTFYADRDGDTFGNPQSAISICGAPDAPPAGYVALAGDCCDADGSAHPGQLTWFNHINACGTWDYNCNGIDEKEFTATPCAGYAASVPADCGRSCSTVILGSPVVRYTQGCR